MSGSWQAERGRLPREVGEDVRVGVAVGPMEFKLNKTSVTKPTALTYLV